MTAFGIIVRQIVDVPPAGWSDLHGAGRLSVRCLRPQLSKRGVLSTVDAPLPRHQSKAQ